MPQGQKVRALLPSLSTLGQQAFRNPIDAIHAYCSSSSISSYRHLRCLTSKPLSERHSPGPPCRLGTSFLAAPALGLQPSRGLNASSRLARCLHTVPAANAAANANSQGGEVAGSSTELDIDTVDCVVIGAGVVGLAVARALAMRGREVVVVEAAGAVGMETSSRHSEVIHAGIYYPEGSLKARLCVEGKHRLYDFCRTHGVPYKRVTKLVVATSKEQLPELSAFRARAARHGVADLEPLSGVEATALEPALRAEGALLSPSTGILDSHAYMQALLADAQAHGALLALHTRMVGAELGPPAVHVSVPSNGASSSNDRGSRSSTRAVGGMPLKVLHLETIAGGPTASGDVLGDTTAAGGAGAGGAGGSGSGNGSARGVGCGPERWSSAAVERSLLRARWVVNAAGLHARRVAASVAGLPLGAVPKVWLAKGNYFSLSGRCPFSRLVYPLPEPGLAGLGTHLTLDLGGQGRFGPDVQWLPDPGDDPRVTVHVDYTVDPSRSASFYPAIRRFFPSLPEGALQPAYSGVRPKLGGPGQPPADFVVQGARGHGVRGWVNLFGVESPGLTSSLALAEHVCSVLDEQ